jgi:hypothetical protein
LPTGELNVAGARELEAEKKPWVENEELKARFTKINAEYNATLDPILKLLNRLKVTYDNTEDKAKPKVPDNLKTYVPYVTNDPLKILRDKVIKLNGEINGLQSSLTSESGQKLGKIAAGKIVNTYETKVKEFVAEAGKFTTMALAYIEPIEKFYFDKDAQNQQDRLNRMTPEERARYLAQLASMAKPPTDELNVAAARKGGTRKRHHSYPLKHSFKNRRV